NRKTRETDANNKAGTFAYDANGNLTSATDRLGRRIDYAYDVLNRRTTETWFDSGGTASQTLTYSFDANGNLLTAKADSGTYTITYDALNRATVVVEPFGLTLTFTYDGAGNRTVVQDSKGGVTTSTYDEANNLTSRQFSSGTPQLRYDQTYNADNVVE